MRHDIFSLPVFIDTVDLTKIEIGNPPIEKTWLSDTPSTFTQNYEIPETTYEYLAEIIGRNLGPENLIGKNPRIGKLWRNVYTETDWQDIHIHPHCTWSFIIYEDVEESRTVFMNPNFKDIQNHLSPNLPDFPLDFRPILHKGDMIIFPSFLMHFVRPGKTGSTISGNIYMDYE